jgi:hypothetical protein
MNAFAEIQVTPLFSRDGMQSQGKSVRIADEEAKTGWSEIGLVSQNYLLVHNSKVKSVVDEIAERTLITDWKQRKLFFDGRRFVYALSTDTLSQEVAVGDVVRFGLIAYNSYDGSRALSVGTYAEHLVCSNGMTSESFFSRFTFRHHQGNINWDEQTEAAFATLLPSSRAKLGMFASTLQKLSRRDLTINDLSILRANYLKEFGAGLWGKVVDKYLHDGKYTAFGLLDACTGVFWHNEKENFSDYRNNSYATDGLLAYAQALRP